jgi:hypothetical protein
MPAIKAARSYSGRGFRQAFGTVSLGRRKPAFCEWRGFDPRLEETGRLVVAATVFSTNKA